MYLQNVIKNPNEDNHKAVKVTIIQSPGLEQPVTQRFLQPALWLYF